jgi:hypothetical protein
MPFVIGESINTISDAVLRAPIVLTIAQNPIYSSAAISIVVILLIIYIFRDVDSDESLTSMTLRTGFWVFLITTGLMFLHNKILLQELSVLNKNVKYEDVFNGGGIRIM